MGTSGRASSGVGLERSCAETPEDWIRSVDRGRGVERMRAWFRGAAYHRHRHDTYAVCLTRAGVQRFWYRGAERFSMVGQVVVLHPDELHDGCAGTEAGLGYDMLYVDPSLVLEAVREVRGPGGWLPFVDPAVLDSPMLAGAVTNAFEHRGEPLAEAELIMELARGLMAADPCMRPAPCTKNLDLRALDRARRFLDAEKRRVVHAGELETQTGLTRYELARQFRRRYGTSPYRYLLMRRLDWTRGQIAAGRPLADVALDAGFADQAHCTRQFKAAYGLTPRQYALLRRPGPVSPEAP